MKSEVTKKNEQRRTIKKKKTKNLPNKIISSILDQEVEFITTVKKSKKDIKKARAAAVATIASQSTMIDNFGNSPPLLLVSDSGSDVKISNTKKKKKPKASKSNDLGNESSEFVFTETEPESDSPKLKKSKKKIKANDGDLGSSFVYIFYSNSFCLYLFPY